MTEFKPYTELEIKKAGEKLATSVTRWENGELKRKASEAILVYKNCGCASHKAQAVIASDRAIEFDQEQQFLKTGVILKETEKGLEYSARWNLEMRKKQQKKGGKNGGGCK